MSRDIVGHGERALVPPFPRDGRDGDPAGTAEPGAAIEGNGDALVFRVSSSPLSQASRARIIALLAAALALHAAATLDPILSSLFVPLYLAAAVVATFERVIRLDPGDDSAGDTCRAFGLTLCAWRVDGLRDLVLAADERTGRLDLVGPALRFPLRRDLSPEALERVAREVSRRTGSALTRRKSADETERFALATWRARLDRRDESLSDAEGQLLPPPGRNIASRRVGEGYAVDVRPIWVNRLPPVDRNVLLAGSAVVAAGAALDAASRVSLLPPALWRASSGLLHHLFGWSFALEMQAFALNAGTLLFWCAAALWLAVLLRAACVSWRVVVHDTGVQVETYVLGRLARRRHHLSDDLAAAVARTDEVNGYSEVRLLRRDGHAVIRPGLSADETRWIVEAIRRITGKI